MDSTTVWTPWRVAAIGIAVSLGLVGCKPQSSAPDNAVAASNGHGLVVAEQRESDKLNAYVEAYNRLLSRHPFHKNLADYLDDNPALKKSSGKIDDYSVPFGDVEDELKTLNDAIALPGALPGVDEKAKALAATLQTLDPILKDAQSYESTKRYLTDNGAHARELNQPLIDGLQAADAAMDALADQIKVQTRKRNEARLAETKPGTVEHERLNVMLRLKDLDAALDQAMDDPKAAPAFGEAIASLDTANQALGELKPDPKAEPAWDPVCKMFKQSVDDVIGQAREVQTDMGNGDHHLGEAADTLLTKGNDAIDKANDCG